ncbi:hypothetical protein [Flagellimonas flava]|uniref:hypothetical protein n=1 Tax=Flagellimonas flava TaxID=570519 RepID=UPI003D65504E
MATKEFKGAKGEWTIFNESEILEGNETLGIESGKGSVVQFTETTSDFSPEEELANAKLIASAPKLLEALQEIQSTIHNHTHNITDENQNKWEVIEVSDIKELVESAISSALEG